MPSHNAKAKTRFEERESIFKSIQEDFDLASLTRSKGNGRVLAAARRKYEARLLALVNQPQFRVDWEGKRQLEFAYEYASRALVGLRSRKYERLLRKLIVSNDRLLRREAAQLIAWMANDSSLSTVLRLMDAKDSDLVANVVEGAGLAALHHHASSRFRQRLFNAVAPLVTGERRLNQSKSAERVWYLAPKALARLDHGKAAKLFTGPACLHSGNRAMVFVLFQINDDLDGPPIRDTHPIRAHLLWPLYEAARTGKLRSVQDWRHEQVMGEILKVTAISDPTRCVIEAKAAIKASGKGWSCLKDAAKESLRICRKIPELASVLRWLESHPDGLTKPAIQIIRAYELAMQVITDGFPLYFRNCGLNWRDAMAGLRTLNLRNAERTLHEGAKVFGRVGPPLEWKDLVAAYEALGEPAVARLGQIGDRFEKYNDAVIPAVERFIGSHRDLFRAASKAKD